MRSVLLSILVLVLVLMLPSMPSGVSAADMADGLIISRVCASHPGEFISLYNHGPPVDINGWRLGDGEGSVTFNTSSIIPMGGSITWAAPGSFFAQLYPDELCLSSVPPSVIPRGILKLADAGDQVFLFDPDGTLRDLVCFGNVEPQAPWTGPPAELKKGSVLVRTGEGAGPEDWSMTIPGLYSVTTGPSTAEVRPLLYPDDALPELVREIDRSRTSIKLACYIIENWSLARHLAGASARGVNVTVLLEGRPVGGVSPNGAAIAYYLQDSGATVWTMRSSDSFRRYDYLHAKYAVFDGESLFVSSENMADSSFTSNRGWAVIVRGGQMPSSADEVFERDLAAKGLDVFPLNTSLARAEGAPGRLFGPVPAGPRSYTASATLITSPFNIEDQLVQIISVAQERVLVQQMRVDESWPEGSELMDAIFKAAARGVSVRLLLDSGLGTEKGNRMVAESLNEKAWKNRWDLQCRLVDDLSGFGRLHNKGVIVDDTVVVGSANWVDNSMQRNREMAALLSSEELSKVFADWFDKDWRGDSFPPTLELPWHYLEVEAGEPVVLDASGCFDASGVVNVTWDLDGDGAADLLGPLHVISLREGQHNISLRVEDALGNVASVMVTVRVEGSGGGALPWLLYVPIPVALSFLMLRRSRRL